jgi:hypothetical protein
LIKIYIYWIEISKYHDGVWLFVHSNLLIFICQELSSRGVFCLLHEKVQEMESRESIFEWYICFCILKIFFKKNNFFYFFALN